MLKKELEEIIREQARKIETLWSKIKLLETEVGIYKKSVKYTDDFSHATATVADALAHTISDLRRRIR